MAPEVFNALERSLMEKLKGLDLLLELADDNRQALIDHDIDAIIRLNEQQTDELSRLDRMQRSSAKLLGRLAGALGVEASQCTLATIASVLPDIQRQRLEELSSQLTDSASRLAAASEVNASLSANALDYIRMTLGAISDDIEENSGGHVRSLVLDTQV